MRTEERVGIDVEAESGEQLCRLRPRLLPVDGRPATSLATGFNSISQQLSTISSQTGQDVSLTLQQINADGQTLQQLNQAIYSAQAVGNAYHYARTLPRTLEDALERFKECGAVRALLGRSFSSAFVRIKEAELEAFQGVISSWERDHLLLKV